MGKNTEQRKTDQQVTMKSNWIRCTEQAAQLYNLPEHMLLDSLQYCSSLNSAGTPCVSTT